MLRDEAELRCRAFVGVDPVEGDGVEGVDLDGVHLPIVDRGGDAKVLLAVNVFQRTNGELGSIYVRAAKAWWPSGGQHASLAARGIGIGFNLELPAGRAEVLCI